MSTKQPHSLNEIVKAKRKELGLTQYQLSAKIGIKISTYRQVEQGLPPSDKTRKILTNWLQS